MTRYFCKPTDYCTGVKYNIINFMILLPKYACSTSLSYVDEVSVNRTNRVVYLGFFLLGWYSYKVNSLYYRKKS